MKLINGDCLEVMKNIQDESIDMILCDLPFGTTKNKWDNVIPLDKLWKEYERVIKENGAIVLNADGMFLAELMMSNRKLWRYNLVWEKPQGTDFLNSNRKPLKSHEEICIFYKHLPKYNKQYWYSKPYSTFSGPKSSNWGDFQSVKIESKDGRRNPLTVLKFNPDKQKFHPTQKPIKLCEYLIKTYTNPGDVVLDNCMGSGSTGVACKNTDRDFIGIELDEDYFNIAKERIGA